MLSFFRGDVSKDPDILKLVQNQTTQWTDCMHKQRKEEWGMLKGTIHKLRTDIQGPGLQGSNNFFKKRTLERSQVIF